MVKVSDLNKKVSKGDTSLSSQTEDEDGSSSLIFSILVLTEGCDDDDDEEEEVVFRAEPALVSAHKTQQNHSYQSMLLVQRSCRTDMSPFIGPRHHSMVMGGGGWGLSS